MISMDFLNYFMYYFKMIIQISFDHDFRLREFNTKNKIYVEDTASSSSNEKKVVIEKNMRFSMKNLEEMGEGFLADGVRMKLDYISKLEEMLVP